MHQCDGAEIVRLEQSFQEIAACPWCGSTERKPAQAFSAKSNRYLDAMAKELKLPPTDLVAKFATFECTDCGASYCDPWLSPRAIEWLFNLGYPQHNYGWANFFDWLDRSKQHETYYFPKADRIWRHLRARIGTIDRYGEVGCPFMGLFPYFESLKRTPAESFEHFERVCAAQRRAQPLPKFMPPLRRVRRIAVGLQKWKNVRRWQKEPPASAERQGDTSVPSELYYVRSPSSMLWGSNCHAFSMTCTAMAMSNFALDVTDLSSVRGPVDVLGFFNTLDHQDRPLAVLEKALDAARFVAIELHDDAEAGKQHLYAITRAIAGFAERRGWLFEEFTDKVHPVRCGAQDNFYLISKRAPPGAAS
jgi:hypothetical protein